MSNRWRNTNTLAVQGVRHVKGHNRSAELIFLCKRNKLNSKILLASFCGTLARAGKGDALKVITPLRVMLISLKPKISKFYEIFLIKLTIFKTKIAIVSKYN